MISIVDRSIDLPLSIETIRKHCRAPENGDDDESLRSYMNSAVWFLEQQTSRVAVPTEFREHFGAWPWGSGPVSGWRTLDGRYPQWSSPYRLGRAPVREVYGVSYLDGDGATVYVANGLFRFDRTPEGGDLSFSPDFTTPIVASDRTGPIRVHYVAGHDVEGTSEGASGYDPDLMYNPVIGHALLLLTANWYENREPVNIGNITTNLPFSLDALLSQLRIFR